MLFAVKKPTHTIGKCLPPLLLIAVISAFVAFSGALTDSNTQHSRDILERALARSITQCYAIEGTYPPDLNYLIDNYGLSYDIEKYYIDYRYIGANLRPDTTIIERN